MDEYNDDYTYAPSRLPPIMDCDNCGNTFAEYAMHGLGKKRICFSCMLQINDDWAPEENPYNWGYEGQGH